MAGELRSEAAFIGLIFKWGQMAGKFGAKAGSDVGKGISKAFRGRHINPGRGRYSPAYQTDAPRLGEWKFPQLAKSFPHKGGREVIDDRPSRILTPINTKKVQDFFTNESVKMGAAATVMTGVTVFDPKHGKDNPFSDRDYGRVNPLLAGPGVKAVDTVFNPTLAPFGHTLTPKRKPGERPPTTPSKRPKMTDAAMEVDGVPSNKVAKTSAKVSAVNYSRVAFRTPGKTRRNRYQGRRRLASARRSLAPRLHYNSNCMYFTETELDTTKIHIIHLSNPGTGMTYDGTIQYGTGQPDGEGKAVVSAGSDYSNGAQWFTMEPKIPQESSPGGDAQFHKYAIPTVTDKATDANLLVFSKTTPRFCMKTESNLNQPSPQGIFLKGIRISGLITGTVRNAHVHIAVVRQRRAYNPHAANCYWGSEKGRVYNPLYANKYKNNTLPNAAIDFAQLAWPNSTNKIDQRLYEVLGESYVTLDSKYGFVASAALTQPTTSTERAFDLNIPVNRKIRPISMMYDQTSGSNYIQGNSGGAQVKLGHKAYNYDNIYPTENIWLIMSTDYTPDATVSPPEVPMKVALNYQHHWLDSHASASSFA